MKYESRVNFWFWVNYPFNHPRGFLQLKQGHFILHHQYLWPDICSEKLRLQRKSARLLINLPLRRRKSKLHGTKSSKKNFFGWLGGDDRWVTLLFFFLRREKLPKHISSATCLLPKRVRNLISQQRPEGADSLMWERAGWVKPGGLGEPTGVKAPAASPRVGRPGPVSLCSLCRWISWVL